MPSTERKLYSFQVTCEYNHIAGLGFLDYVAETKKGVKIKFIVIFGDSH